MKVKLISWIAAAAVLAGCDSPLDVNPTAQLPTDGAFTNARSLELGIKGTYDALQTSSLYSRELLVYPEMYADNLDFTGTYGTDGEVANRDVRPSNGAIASAWSDSYDAINRANNVLAALETVEGVPEDDAARFQGEALFLRALNYFNLVRYFGGVPLVLEPSEGITEDSKVARSPVAEVYAQVEADLTEAASLLPAAGSPARATQGAANALLAKVHLEQQEWTEARDRATDVIESGAYRLVESYGDLFTVENSTEAIFELQYTTNDNNALAFWFFPQPVGRLGFSPSAELAAAYESGDARLDASITETDDGTRYGVKYTSVDKGDDNVIVLRLADLYLIRAEANARLNAAAETVRADIDAVRTRAGLAPLTTSVTSADALMNAVLQERRVEFAMEGNRFFDLRRAGKAQELLDIPEHRLLFPIPQREIDVNDRLEQNPGY